RRACLDHNRIAKQPTGRRARSAGDRTSRFPLCRCGCGRAVVRAGSRARIPTAVTILRARRSHGERSKRVVAVGEGSSETRERSDRTELGRGSDRAPAEFVCRSDDDAAAGLRERDPHGQHVALERTEHELARQRELFQAALGAAERVLGLQVHDAVEARLAKHLAVAEEIDDAGADRGFHRAPAHAAREMLAGERQRNALERVLATALSAAAEASAEPGTAAGAATTRAAASAATRSGAAAGTAAWAAGTAALRLRIRSGIGSALLRQA